MFDLYFCSKQVQIQIVSTSETGQQLAIGFLRAGEMSGHCKVSIAVCRTVAVSFCLSHTLTVYFQNPCDRVAALPLHHRLVNSKQRVDIISLRKHCLLVLLVSVCCTIPGSPRGNKTNGQDSKSLWKRKELTLNV